MFPEIIGAKSDVVLFRNAKEGHWYIDLQGKLVCKLTGDWLMRYWHNTDKWCVQVETCYNNDYELKPVEVSITVK